MTLTSTLSEFVQPALVVIVNTYSVVVTGEATGFGMLVALKPVAGDQL